jgi:glycine oxidase
LIVAGAGIIGLSCAWRLAQRGHTVTVFDAREAAREASWAGAGMLAPGGELDSESPATRLALNSLSQYPAFVRELEEESGIPIDFRRSGGIEVAFGDSECESLDRRAEAQQALGIASERCAYAGWRARFYPGDALVDPRDVTRALLAACLKRGVSVREHEPVLSISGDGGSVETGRGIHRDDGVVIAAGAWSASLYPGLRRTMPVRGHLISWLSPPGLLAPILRHGNTYLLQRTSGLLIAGTTTEHAGFDRSVDENSVADIHTRASRLMPGLAGEAPHERWNGFRPGIDAAGPAVGRIAGTSVWTAFGHYRNGILMAPETARLIAESVR